MQETSEVLLSINPIGEFLAPTKATTVHRKIQRNLDPSLRQIEVYEDSILSLTNSFDLVVVSKFGLSEVFLEALENKAMKPAMNAMIIVLKNPISAHLWISILIT